MRDELQRMHLGEFMAGDQRVLQRTETTREQVEIFAAMGVSEPPRFTKIELKRTQTAS